MVAGQHSVVPRGEAAKRKKENKRVEEDGVWRCDCERRVAG